MKSSTIRPLEPEHDSHPLQTYVEGGRLSITSVETVSGRDDAFGCSAEAANSRARASPQGTSIQSHPTDLQQHPYLAMSRSGRSGEWTRQPTPFNAHQLLECASSAASRTTTGTCSEYGSGVKWASPIPSASSFKASNPSASIQIPSHSYQSTGIDGLLPTTGSLLRKKNKGKGCSLCLWVAIALTWVLVLNFAHTALHLTRSHSNAINIGSDATEHQNDETQRHIEVKPLPSESPLSEANPIADQQRHGHGIDLNEIIAAAQLKARKAAQMMGEAVEEGSGKAKKLQDVAKEAPLESATSHESSRRNSAPYLGYLGQGAANPFPSTPSDAELFRRRFSLEACPSSAIHCEHTPNALGLIRVPGLEDPTFVGAALYNEHKCIAANLPPQYPLSKIHKLMGGSEAISVEGGNNRSPPMRVDVVYTIVDPLAKSFKKDKLIALRRSLAAKPSPAAEEEVRMEAPPTAGEGADLSEYLYIDKYNDTSRNVPYEALIAAASLEALYVDSPYMKRAGMTPKAFYRDQNAAQLWEVLRMRHPAMLSGGYADIESAALHYQKAIGKSEAKLEAMLDALTLYEAADEEIRTASEKRQEKKNRDNVIQKAKSSTPSPRSIRLAAAEAATVRGQRMTKLESEELVPNGLEERLLRLQADEEANRYRDFGEFSVSLRATFSNLYGDQTAGNISNMDEDVSGSSLPPLMRYVFIVVAHLDQIPQWLPLDSFWTVNEAIELGLLDTDESLYSKRTSTPANAHRRIIIVEHKDILAQSELPSFNSYAIESALYRIPGLSRHFLYLNNDMVITREASWFDFFSPVVVYRNATDSDNKSEVTDELPVVRWLPTIYHDTTTGAYTGIDGTVRAQSELLNALVRGGSDNEGNAYELPNAFKIPTGQAPPPRPDRLEFFLSYAHAPTMIDSRLLMAMMGHPHMDNALHVTRGHTARQEGDVFLALLYTHFAVIHRHNLDVGLTNGVFQSILKETFAAPLVSKKAKKRRTTTEAPPETFFGGFVKSRRNRKNKSVESTKIVNAPEAATLLDSLGRRRVSLHHYISFVEPSMKQPPHPDTHRVLNALRGIFSLLPSIVSAYGIDATIPISLGLQSHDTEVAEEVSLSRQQQGSTDHWLVDFCRCSFGGTTSVSLTASIRYYFHMATNRENVRSAIDDLKPRLGRVLFVTFNDDLGPAIAGGEGPQLGDHIPDEGTWMDGAPVYSPSNFLLQRKNMLDNKGHLQYVGLRAGGFEPPGGIEFGFYISPAADAVGLKQIDAIAEDGDFEAYNNPNLPTELGLPDPALVVVGEAPREVVIRMIPSIISQMINDSVLEEELRLNPIPPLEGGLTSTVHINDMAANRTARLADLIILLCRINLISRHTRDVANSIVKLERTLVVRRHQRFQLSKADLEGPEGDLPTVTTQDVRQSLSNNVYGGAEMVEAYQILADRLPEPIRRHQKDTSEQ